MPHSGMASQSVVCAVFMKSTTVNSKDSQMVDMLKFNFESGQNIYRMLG